MNAAKLFALAVILAAVVQGALYGSAWMDDHAFRSAVQQCLGDNMTARQMENDIRTRAQQAKIAIAKPEDVKVTIDCGEGGGPSSVTSRLGSGIQVTKSCTVTGRVHYVRKVGVFTKAVDVQQSKSFVAGATVHSPSSGAPGMPRGLPNEVPGRPIPDL